MIVFLQVSFYRKLYELHAVKAGIWQFVLQIRKQFMKMYGIKICVMCHSVLVSGSCLSF